jgi:hypothetical protein
LRGRRLIGPFTGVGVGLLGRETLPGSIAVAVVVAVGVGSVCVGVGAVVGALVTVGNTLGVPEALPAPSSCERTTIHVIPAPPSTKPATNKRTRRRRFDDPSSSGGGSANAAPARPGVSTSTGAVVARIGAP